MASPAELAMKLGFPEEKVRIALQRRQGNVNQAAEYLFTHGDKDDGFWGLGAPAAVAYVPPAVGYPQRDDNPPVYPAGSILPHPAPAPAPHYNNQPVYPAPRPAPAPAPPAEPPLSSYTTEFASAEPKADHAGFQKWTGTQAWSGPDVRGEHKGLVGHAESAAMEGRRYWPGEGVIPKYPNGCQDRCFACATSTSTCALGIFDGSGGENAEKVATVVSGTVRELLQGARPAIDGSLHDWPSVLKQAFVRADVDVLRRPEHLWEDSAGCTGVVAVVDLSLAQATVAHVGDSRALHFVPEDGSEAMHVAWQSKDHESTERAFGHRMRKSSPNKPTPVPEVAIVPGVKDGSVLALVSDGILNAYATPELAVAAMARQLCHFVTSRRTPARRAESKPLLEATLSEHMALTVLREAEKAAFEHHAGNPSRFSRDDMSISLLFVEIAAEADPPSPAQMAAEEAARLAAEEAEAGQLDPAVEQPAAEEPVAEPAAEPDAEPEEPAAEEPAAEEPAAEGPAAETYAEPDGSAVEELAVEEPAAAEPAPVPNAESAMPAAEEPAAEEPAAEEPAAEEPAAEEPAAEEPAAEEPAAEVPAAEEPAAEEPAAEEPAAEEPAAEEPAAEVPAAEEPAAEEPAAEEPAAEVPAAEEPAAAEPAAEEPAAGVVSDAHAVRKLSPPAVLQVIEPEPQAEPGMEPVASPAMAVDPSLFTHRMGCACLHSAPCLSRGLHTRRS